MPFAPLQPLSREVPVKCRRRREAWRLRKRVTGAVLSLQLPPVAPAVGVPLLVFCAHSVGPPVWVETKVPGLLPAAVSLSSSVVFGSSRTSTAGHTTVGLQVLGSMATPHTSGERPQTRPLMIPVTGPTFVHTPISFDAVPTSAGMSDIRASLIVGFVSSPSFVWAAV